MKLGNISIRNKLIICFGIVIILSMAIIGVTMNTFSFGMRFAGETSISRNVTMYKDIARFQEKEFIINSTDVNRSNVLGSVDESLKNLRIVMASKDDYAIRQMDKLKTIENNLLSYKESFTRYTLLEGQKKEVRDKINDLRDDISASLARTGSEKQEEAKALLYKIFAEGQSVIGSMPGSDVQMPRRSMTADFEKLLQTIDVAISGKFRDYLDALESFASKNVIQNELIQNMDVSAAGVSRINTEFLQNSVEMLKDTIFSSVLAALALLVFTIIISVILSVVITI